MDTTRAPYYKAHDDPAHRYHDCEQTPPTRVNGADLDGPAWELVHLIEQAGLTPLAFDRHNPASWQQVYQAVMALHPLATAQQIADRAGSGRLTADHLPAILTATAAQFPDALADLPFYPQIETVDHRLAITAGSGEIQVAAGQSFRWRGHRRYRTEDYAEPARTFAHNPNRAYHLDWTRAEGFALRDLTDAAYNPGALAETDSVFDSDYDRMLVARVVTDGANVATVTALANAVRYQIDFHDAHREGDGTTRPTYTLDLARTCEPRLILNGDAVTDPAYPTAFATDRNGTRITCAYSPVASTIVQARVLAVQSLSRYQAVIDARIAEAAGANADNTVYFQFVIDA